MQNLSINGGGTNAIAGFFGLMGEAPFLQPERLVSPKAWWGHQPFAFWIVSVLRPRSLAELGVHTGTSYCAFCQMIARYAIPCRAIGVDTWQGDAHAGRYGAHVFDELSAYHNPKYGQFSTLVRATFDDALKDVADGSLDLLHIDGLHSYEAVKHDFETWLPKMSERGVVLFHDIAVRERGFGVWQLWEEITKHYPSFSFQHCNGLGVLGVGNQLPAALKILFEAEKSAPDSQSIRMAFEQLGDGIVHGYKFRTMQKYSPFHILQKIWSVVSP